MKLLKNKFRVVNIALTLIKNKLINYRLNKDVLFLTIPFFAPLPDIRSASDIILTITIIINKIIPVLIALAVFYFLWGLLRYVANGDNEELRKKARGKIMFGIISIFVMISVWGLVNLISNSLGLETTLSRTVPQISVSTSSPTTVVEEDAGTPIVPCGINDPNGEKRCRLCHLWVLAKNIIDFLMIAIIPLIGIALIFGGFFILTSAGSESKYSRGKEIITSAITGLIIALIAWLVINTIIQFIANPDAFIFSGEWFGLPPCP